MLGIVISRADEVSVAIGEQLQAVASWEQSQDESRPDADGGGTVYRTEGVELREFEAMHLDLDRPAAAFADDIDLLVFASRHAGETGELLTAHHTGNVGAADHGGDPAAFARACPNALDRVRKSLAAHAPPGYEVGVECTHHGPTAVGAPSLFVEVGSGPEQWDDPAAAEAVARAILDLRGVAPDRDPDAAPGSEAGDRKGTGGNRRHIVGFGGGHYAPRFERILRETDWAVGHVCADWGLDDLEGFATSQADREAVIEAAFRESRARYGLVATEREWLSEAIANLGYETVSETWLRETTGLPLSFVDRVENAMGSVTAGLRFGEPARGYDGDFEQMELPADLLTEATGIDPEQTLQCVDEVALAYRTAEAGTVVTGPVALVAADDRADIVDGLASILEQRYDRIEREPGVIVAHEQRFDPEKARTLGIPEGPAFGKLADGEPVEVDGREIDPETVETDATTRFDL